MTDTGMAQALEALTALGSAYRGDWSEVDGRTLRDQLEEIGCIIRRASDGHDVASDVAGFYVVNRICGVCKSWTEHCLCIGEEDE